MNGAPRSDSKLSIDPIIRGFFGTFFDNSSQLELAFFEFFHNVPLSFSFQLMSQPIPLWNLQRIGCSASHCKSLEILDICFII